MMSVWLERNCTSPGNVIDGGVMAKFHGTIEELKAIISNAGLSGDWRPTGQGYQFKTPDGGCLNWWPSKGTLNCQGPTPHKDNLESAVGVALGTPAPPSPVTPPTGIAPFMATTKPRRIFVVHGHDHIAREQLERIIYILGLEPFVLQNTSGGGLTIIEALEQQIGADPEAEFGIVLMTPDDIGYSKKDGEKEAKPRARQNVVLELGMLLASLGRKRVAVLVKGHIERPSDTDGIIYMHFNDHVKETVPRLTERLRECGFDLDGSKIARAAS
jgi:hypothetical protein